MNTLAKDDVRGGWLGLPQLYQPLDFLGITFGALLAWIGATEKRPLFIAIGAVMLYIHGQRFLYAPQTRDGFLRLARELGISPQDLELAAAELRIKG